MRICVDADEAAGLAIEICSGHIGIKHGLHAAIVKVNLGLLASVFDSDLLLLVQLILSPLLLFLLLHDVLCVHFYEFVQLIFLIGRLVSLSVVVLKTNHRVAGTLLRMVRLAYSLALNWLLSLRRCIWDTRARRSR